MTMTLKFDEGKTIINHAKFSEGIVIGITFTDNDSGNMFELYPIISVNGFIFNFDCDMSKAVARYKGKFDYVCTNIDAVIDKGLEFMTDIGLFRKLSELGVGAITQKYIKTLIDSTKPIK